MLFDGKVFLTSYGKMSQKDLIGKLREVIVDYENLVVEQRKQAKELTGLISLVQTMMERQNPGEDPVLEQQFSAIKNHEDLCTLDDKALTSMIPIAARHISDSLASYSLSSWYSQGDNLKCMHAILFIWDCFKSRNSVFHQLPSCSLQLLRSTVLHPNFAVVVSPVLSPSEVGRLISAVQFL